MCILLANIEQQNLIIRKSYLSFFMSFLPSCHIVNMKVLEVYLIIVERRSLKNFSITQNMVFQCIY